MNLSPGQEEQLLRSCESLIWLAVHQFRRCNATYNYICKEDLFQEASIVMLEHIRRSPDEATARKAPLHDMKNAMCRYLMGMNVVHIPMRTTDFSKNTFSAVDVSDVPEDLVFRAAGDENAEDVETYASFDVFLDTLSKQERVLVEHKLQGQTTRDAGKAAGYGDATAMRVLKRIRKKYAAFAA